MANSCSILGSSKLFPKVVAIPLAKLVYNSNHGFLLDIRRTVPWMLQQLTNMVDIARGCHLAATTRHKGCHGRPLITSCLTRISSSKQFNLLEIRESNPRESMMKGCSRPLRDRRSLLHIRSEFCKLKTRILIWGSSPHPHVDWERYIHLSLGSTSNMPWVGFLTPELGMGQ